MLERKDPKIFRIEFPLFVAFNLAAFSGVIVLPLLLVNMFLHLCGLPGMHLPVLDNLGELLSPLAFAWYKFVFLFS